MPIRTDQHSGWFLGVNSELSRLKRRFSQSRNSFELRGMAGYRNDDWLLAVNPLFGWSLSPGYRGRSPDLSLATKVARTVKEGLAVGVEYYADLGTVARTRPVGEQANSLYAVVDWSGGGWDLNFGVGRGLNGSAQPTMKATAKAK